MLRCPGSPDGGTPERFYALSREQRAGRGSGGVRTRRRDRWPSPRCEQRTRPTRQVHSKWPLSLASGGSGGVAANRAATPTEAPPQAGLAARGEVGTPVGTMGANCSRFESWACQPGKGANRLATRRPALRLLPRAPGLRSLSLGRSPPKLPWGDQARSKAWQPPLKRDFAAPGCAPTLAAAPSSSQVPQRCQPHLFTD